MSLQVCCFVDVYTGSFPMFLLFKLESLLYYHPQAYIFFELMVRFFRGIIILYTWFASIKFWLRSLKWYCLNGSNFYKDFFYFFVTKFSPSSSSTTLIFPGSTKWSVTFENVVFFGTFLLSIDSYNFHLCYLVFLLFERSVMDFTFVVAFINVDLWIFSGRRILITTIAFIFIFVNIRVTHFLLLWLTLCSSTLPKIISVWLRNISFRWRLYHSQCFI